MKFIKMIFFLLFIAMNCKSYANENKYIFVGKNGNLESEKNFFILEIMGDDLENHVLINENGEIYLKVDRIVEVPSDKVACGNSFSETPVRSSLISSNISRDNNNSEDIYLFCPKCKINYYGKPWNRSCPICGRNN